MEYKPSVKGSAVDHLVNLAHQKASGHVFQRTVAGVVPKFRQIEVHAQLAIQPVSAGSD